MRKFQSRLTLPVLFALVAFALTLAEPASLSAQKRKPIPSAPVKPPTPDSAPSSTPNYRTADQAVLEMSILMSRRTLITDLERERHRLASQLAQDLEQLEQLNAEKLVPLSSAKSLDYKNLAQASAEIRARATRIKFYSPLALVDRTGEKIRYEAEANQLGTMLPQLSRAIKSFVGNPVFRLSAPNDDELRSVAAHDLEGIIKLSDTINKIAKRLSKTLVASR
jgi:biopolymer transport protein ExbD